MDYAWGGHICFSEHLIVRISNKQYWFWLKRFKLVTWKPYLKLSNILTKVERAKSSDLIDRTVHTTHRTAKMLHAMNQGVNGEIPFEMWFVLKSMINNSSRFMWAKCLLYYCLFAHSPHESDKIVQLFSWKFSDCHSCGQIRRLKYYVFNGRFSITLHSDPLTLFYLKSYWNFMCSA